MLAGAGTDQYQTVTIVPNQENNGEVSYVLIVQQNDSEEKKGGEMGEVYDFETENDPDYEEEEEDGEEKSRIKYKPTQVTAFNCPILRIQYNMVISIQGSKIEGIGFFLLDLGSKTRHFSSFFID